MTEVLILQWLGIMILAVAAIGAVIVGAVTVFALVAEGIGKLFDRYRRNRRNGRY